MNADRALKCAAWPRCQPPNDGEGLGLSYAALDSTCFTCWPTEDQYCNVVLLSTRARVACYLGSINQQETGSR